MTNEELVEYILARRNTVPQAPVTIPRNLAAHGLRDGYLSPNDEPARYWCALVRPCISVPGQEFLR